jgi:hypothetical protein
VLRFRNQQQQACLSPSEPQCTTCCPRTEPWSIRAWILNREYPRTVRALKTPSSLLRCSKALAAAQSYQALVHAPNPVASGTRFIRSTRRRGQVKRVAPSARAPWPLAMACGHFLRLVHPLGQRTALSPSDGCRVKSASSPFISLRQPPIPSDLASWRPLHLFGVWAQGKVQGPIQGNRPNFIRTTLSIPFSCKCTDAAKWECYAPRLERTDARSQANDHRAAALHAMRCNDAPCPSRTVGHGA